MDTTTQSILEAFNRKDYYLRSGDLSPNIFGVRSTKEHKDLYPHDFLGVLFMDNNEWNTI